ncbi:hypothetical protein [Tenacibaculum finnmarkense]|uniref:hypothetical protein n=1 Tax=Tenacibaculum finnmarkense TaxID=2781243 RepID=UPI001EFB35A5|nr:hypothetical protein [Tenacibaculum finnmarkense]MCG8236887.1 hypothetical protein [Tenacibaculum finnmarkense genomovar ulcerans]MCG8831419.1 hypothetical protein [Tenacibaculum finnmarkense]
MMTNTQDYAIITVQHLFIDFFIKEKEIPKAILIPEHNYKQFKESYSLFLSVKKGTPEAISFFKVKDNIMYYKGVKVISVNQSLFEVY